MNIQIGSAGELVFADGPLAIEQMLLGVSDTHYRLEAAIRNSLPHDVLATHVLISATSEHKLMCMPNYYSIIYEISDTLSVSNTSADSRLQLEGAISKDGLWDFSYKVQGSFTSGLPCYDENLTLEFDSSFVAPANNYTPFYLLIPRALKIVSSTVITSPYPIRPPPSEEERHLDSVPTEVDIYEYDSISLAIKTNLQENPISATLYPPPVTARKLMRKGDELAREGDLDGAINLYNSALALDPRLGVEAREGDLEGAISLYHQVLGLDPYLGVDPQRRARECRASSLSAMGRDLVEQGEIEEAITAYTEAQALDPDIAISPWDLNHLCRAGSLLGYATEVDFACHRAVELAINTESGLLNGDICRNSKIANLADTVLPTCKRAVELASYTNDALLSYKICLLRNISGLATIVAPACERAAIPTEIPFGRAVSGILDEDNEFNLWTFKGEKGQKIRISLISDVASLALLGPDGTVLIGSDYGGDYRGREAVIDSSDLPELPDTGIYTIVVSEFVISSHPYTLVIMNEGVP